VEAQMSRKYQVQAGDTLSAIAKRFYGDATLFDARLIEVAPFPHWSGDAAVQLRSTRSGNRQLNMALHRIAVTQIHMDSLGQVYYRKRLAEGDSRGHALRSFKRRLARVSATPER
jgi:transposase